MMFTKRRRLFLVCEPLGRWFQRAIFAFFCVLFLSSIEFAAAGEEGNALPAAASNQPIAIEEKNEPATDEPAIPQTVPTTESRELSGASSASDSAVSDSVTTVAAENPTMVRRGRTVTESQVPQASDNRPWYRNSLFSLALVLSLIMGCFWGLRKILPSLRAPQHSEAIKIIARTALTPKQHLALVKCGQRMILIGVSPDRIDSLSEVEDAHEISTLPTREVSKNSKLTGHIDTDFDDVLEREQDSYSDDLQNVGDAVTVEGITKPSRNVARLARPPLKELLDRVRALKS